jgi:hypothetical protein
MLDECGQFDGIDAFSSFIQYDEPISAAQLFQDAFRFLGLCTIAVSVAIGFVFGLQKRGVSV